MTTDRTILPTPSDDRLESASRIEFSVVGLVTTCRHESRCRRHASGPSGDADPKRVRLPRRDRGPGRRARGTIVALGDQRATTMLRIRIHAGSGQTVLVLEGRLAGPWLEELARSWATLRSAAHAARVRVDLEGVTFVSAAGKALLARLHDDGALLTARGCMTRAMIDEIATQRPVRPEESESNT